MKLLSVRALGLSLAVAGALVSGGCTKLKSHQGYVIDPDLVNSVQPGVDTRDSVTQTLGSPTFVAQFNDKQWIYLSRDSRNLAYNRPRPVEQTAIRITFDDAGTVTAIDKTGVDQVAFVAPSDKKTPTLGRERGFFEDLFGNIGTVGAPVGAGGPGGGGPGQ
ncbi:outer membrane protein assembly factor BamE [Sphingomonas sp. BGYR3]|uniref:outer membrane protein assembly factor BamE n=1 Tax=Sphingomonas sp. BGYR3 TaxID=2975483 RepID=UPI0021A73562|nr:outer membrane protein assembly factor BamE [Sphingomonas sp. BGYR3]MDG5487983.1 outer membrane protein assembly factor BamE [Sphingomonas sp. BGYR3]